MHNVTTYNILWIYWIGCKRKKSCIQYDRYALCRLSSHEFKFLEKHGKVFKTNHKALIRFYITETFQHKTPQFRIWDHHVYLSLH